MTASLAADHALAPLAQPANPHFREGEAPVIAFYGSSLLSSYWNGAATYYRGILQALARHGYRIRFFEPDAFERQQHRDIDPPDWAEVVVYDATEAGLRSAVAQAAMADVVVKASGVGVFDDVLLDRLMAVARPDAVMLFWDVDAPATLAEMRLAADHPVRRALPGLDAVFTYGGGPPVIAAYRGFGAARCETVYNALDPATHYPVAPDSRFSADLAFLGNRLPDRETRVETFFLEPAAQLPERCFLLGGSGWESRHLPRNMRALGHVYTADHNAFNVTPRAVLNIARESMADMGYSPATRIFEAAGAGACIISDAWTGIEDFLIPGEEILLARDGADVVGIMRELDHDRARAIGAAARRKVLEAHTYDRRGTQVHALLGELIGRRRLGSEEARLAGAAQ